MFGLDKVVDNFSSAAHNLVDNLSDAAHQGLSAADQVIDGATQLADAAQKGCKAVGDAAMSVSSAVGDAATDAAGGFFDTISDTFSDIGFGDVLDGFNALIDGGIGGLAEHVCDKMGLPEWVGDVASIVGNVVTGQVHHLIADIPDLGANIAEACGHEKLAGYLDAASTYGDIGIKIGTAVATTVLTGGAGAGLIGAQAASTLSTINTAVGAVRCGLEAGAALENGDYMGALTSGLGALAGFNQVGGALGVSDDVLQVTRAVAEHGSDGCPCARRWQDRRLRSPAPARGRYPRQDRPG